MRYSPVIWLVGSALLLTACGEESGPAPAPATGNDAGAVQMLAAPPRVDPKVEPREAFERYRQAIRAGDAAALRAALTPERAASLADGDTAEVLEVMRDTLPANERVVDVRIDGWTAVVELKGRTGGRSARAEVVLRRHEDDWRVDRELWTLDPGAASGETPGPDAAPAAPRPRRSRAWRLDLEGVEIPSGPAAGVVKNRPFRVAEAVLENDILTLRDGPLLEMKAQITVFLFLDEGDLDGRTFAFTPEQGRDGGVSAHVHLQSRTDSGGIDIEAKAAGYSMLLRFGKEKDRKLPGSIYVCFPDAEESYVAGTFEATLR